MPQHHGPRPAEPRIPPLPVEEWDDSARRAVRLDDGDADRAVPAVLNIFATLANHPDLMRRWVVFANHVLAKSTLDPREREIAILRMGWNCGAVYEWGQHVAIGRECGLTDDDIARIAAGADAEGFTDHEAAIVRAADELWSDACITDATWAALATTYSEAQLMDLVFACGQYALVSMALNSFGVQPEPGLEGWPAGAG